MLLILAVLGVFGLILVPLRIMQGARSGHVETQARVIEMMRRATLRRRQETSDTESVETVSPDAEAAIPGADTMDMPHMQIAASRHNARRLAAFMGQHVIGTMVTVLITVIVIAVRLGSITLPAFMASWQSSWGNPLGWAADPANRQWLAEVIGQWITLAVTIPYGLLQGLTEAMGFHSGFAMAMVALAVFLIVRHLFGSHSHHTSSSRTHSHHTNEHGRTFLGLMVVVAFVLIGGAHLMGDSGLFDGYLQVLRGEAEVQGARAEIHGLQRHLTAAMVQHERKVTISKTANVYEDNGTPRKDTAGRSIQLEPKTEVFLWLTEKPPAALGPRAQVLVCPVVDNDECDMDRSGWVYYSLVDDSPEQVLPDMPHIDTARVFNSLSLRGTSQGDVAEAATTLADLKAGEVKRITLTPKQDRQKFCANFPTCWLPAGDGGMSNEDVIFTFPDTPQRDVRVGSNGHSDLVHVNGGRYCYNLAKDAAWPQTIDVWRRGGTKNSCTRPG